MLGDHASAPSNGDAFWIDDEYDREKASDGVSRFGAYVRQSTSLPECWDGTWDDLEGRRARFAAATWETATSPVMSPGYVRKHPRVLSERVQVSGWDLSLAGVVELVTPWPQPLARSRDWQGGMWWRNWRVETFGGREFYREPGEDEMVSGRYLMASARLVFPLPVDALPAAPSGPRDNVVGAAREAVLALVAAMNAVVTPVIGALERS